jgi:hypothetical protein
MSNFLYTINEPTDKEIWTINPFTIASKKYLGINIIMEVQDLYN